MSGSRGDETIWVYTSIWLTYMYMYKDSLQLTYFYPEMKEIGSNLTTNLWYMPHMYSLMYT